MAKVLVTIHKVFAYSGSELVVIDLSRYLVSQGYDVTLATYYVHPRFEGLLSEIGVSLIAINSGCLLQTKKFDLIWAHHSQTLDACLFDLKISSDKILFSSLSPFAPDECPPSYASDLTLLIANSEENKDALVGYGYDPKFISIFPNPVADSVYVLRRGSADNPLKTIGVVTNHLSSELSDAIVVLRNENNIVIDIYGIDHNYCLVTPELLLSYDLIVTIGRTVQQCIVLEIPVYCYDHFGGPGYLNACNYSRAEYFNFSGRCSSKKSADQICSEILGSYEQSLNDIHEISSSSREQFRLSCHVDHILSEICRCPNVDLESSGDFQQALRLRNQSHDFIHNQCTAELYWLETKQDYYSEPQKVSVCYSYEQCDISVHFVFPRCTANVIALRFDVSDRPGLFIFNEMYLKNRSGEIVWSWDKLTSTFDDLSPDVINLAPYDSSGAALFSAIGFDAFFRINLGNEYLDMISAGYQFVVSFKTVDLRYLVLKLTEVIDSFEDLKHPNKPLDHPSVCGFAPKPSLALTSDLEDVLTLLRQALSARDHALHIKEAQINLMREDLTRAEAQLGLLKDVLIHHLDDGGTL